MELQGGDTSESPGPTTASQISRCLWTLPLAGEAHLDLESIRGWGALIQPDSATYRTRAIREHKYRECRLNNGSAAGQKGRVRQRTWLELHCPAHRTPGWKCRVCSAVPKQPVEDTLPPRPAAGCGLLTMYPAGAGGGMALLGPPEYPLTPSVSSCIPQCLFPRRQHTYSISKFLLSTHYAQGTQQPPFPRKPTEPTTDLKYYLFVIIQCSLIFHCR